MKVGMTAVRRAGSLAASKASMKVDYSAVKSAAQLADWMVMMMAVQSADTLEFRKVGNSVIGRVVMKADRKELPLAVMTAEKMGEKSAVN